MKNARRLPQLTVMAISLIAITNYANAVDTKTPTTTKSTVDKSSPSITTKKVVAKSPQSQTAKPVQASPKTITSASVTDYTAGMAVAGDSSEVTGSIDTISSWADSAKLSQVNLNDYAKTINEATWTPDTNVNSALTVKLQALLDWNHTSSGAMDGGWGASSKKALRNFQTMNNLPADGHMNQKTWDLLTKNIPANQPVLMTYTLTQKDVEGPYATIPTTLEAKSKAKGLYYQHIKEMLAERFHMDIRYLEKLNQNKSFKVGEKIMVFNPGKPLQKPITRLIANKAENTLYAYNGSSLIATYPAMVGSTAIPTPTGIYPVKNQVKNPYYRATVFEGNVSKDYMLPPGPNNPVGVVWIGLTKANYGIQGTPFPESYGKPATHGTLRLSNWDVLEVYENVDTNTSVEFK